MRWFVLLLLLSRVSHNQLTLKSIQKITVGGGFACHYPPDQLNQAIREHNILYLSIDTVFPPIQINNKNVTLIGGLTDCGDWPPIRQKSQKSLISGFHQNRAVTISSTDKAKGSQIEFINLRIIDGHASNGGGLHITGPARVTLKNSVIEHNIADNRGGGVVLTGSHVALHLTNSVIRFNRAKKLGGGISCEGEHRIKLEQARQVQANQAPIAQNFLLNSPCFVKIN